LTFLVQETNSSCFSSIIQCTAEMNFKSSHTFSYQVLFCFLNEALICSMLVTMLPLGWAHPSQTEVFVIRKESYFGCSPELFLSETLPYSVCHHLLFSTFEWPQLSCVQNSKMEPFTNGQQNALLLDDQADGKVVAPHWPGSGSWGRAVTADALAVCHLFNSLSKVCEP
jgi:hypothetical protein